MLTYIYNYNIELLFIDHLSNRNIITKRVINDKRRAKLISKIRKTNIQTNNTSRRLTRSNYLAGARAAVLRAASRWRADTKHIRCVFSDEWINYNSTSLISSPLLFVLSFPFLSSPLLSSPPSASLLSSPLLSSTLLSPPSVSSLTGHAPGFCLSQSFYFGNSTWHRELVPVIALRAQPQVVLSRASSERTPVGQRRD